MHEKVENEKQLYAPIGWEGCGACRTHNGLHTPKQPTHCDGVPKVSLHHLRQSTVRTCAGKEMKNEMLADHCLHTASQLAHCHAIICIKSTLHTLAQHSECVHAQALLGMCPVLLCAIGAWFLACILLDMQPHSPS